MTDARPGGPADDELRLPRPPGVFRLFFARHPWFVDGVLVGLFVVPTALYFVLHLLGFSRTTVDVPAWVVVVGMIGAAALAVAVLFRRAHPLVLVGRDGTPEDQGLGAAAHGGAQGPHSDLSEGGLRDRDRADLAPAGADPEGQFLHRRSLLT